MIKFLVKKIEDLKWYWINRIDQTHVLRTSFPKGKFYEFDDKVFNALFNEFQYFVESSYGGLHVMLNENKTYEAKKNVWGKKVYPEAAIEYLTMLSTACDPNAPESWNENSMSSSKRTLDLYLWCTQVYPTRNAYVESGYAEFSKKHPVNVKAWSVKEERDKQDLEVEQQRVKLSTAFNDLEAKYKKEKEEKMIELIKLLPYLWI